MDSVFRMLENEPNLREGGFSGLIRRILALLSELFGVELQEEKGRIIELLILASATLLFGALSLTIITFGVVSLLLDSNQIEVLFIVGVIYAVVAVLLFFYLRRKLRLESLIFKVTAEELKKDSEWIKRDL